MECFIHITLKLTTLDFFEKLMLIWIFDLIWMSGETLVGKHSGKMFHVVCYQIYTHLIVMMKDSSTAHLQCFS